MPSQTEIPALAQLPATLIEQAQAVWPQWQKRLSPRGMDNAIEATRALQHLGRGDAPAKAWLSVVAEISQEVGEDVLPQLCTSALSLASKVSGSVIEALLQTAPIAARRLADPELFLQYVQFVSTMAGQAPRAVRPMLEQLDTLFEQLTLGGLRRWANWGVQAYRTDYESQISYFSLQSRQSLAMLQQERKGTLLVDTQRQLNMYLRALWGRDFFLRPTAGDHESREGYLPYIEGNLIYIPDAYDDVQGIDGVHITGIQRYRAACAHAAAHLVYTRQPMPSVQDPWLRALIEVFEDARVQALAIQGFPGLRDLWAPLQYAGDEDGPGHMLERLARALLDPDYSDPNPAIRDLLQRWFVLAQTPAWRQGDPTVVIGIAQEAAAALDVSSFHPRRDRLFSPYRDDNRYIWSVSALDIERGSTGDAPTRQPRRHYVNVMEFCNELEVETAGDDAQEIWVLGTELFPYEDHGVSFNETEGKAVLAEPVYYPEWDYTIAHERPSWVTVQPRHVTLADPAIVDEVLLANRFVIEQIRQRLQALQPQGVQRVRKLEDGDELDLNAAVAHRIDLHQKRQPDPRIMMRQVRHERDVSVILLLDLSASTHELVKGQDYSVLDLTRKACVLLARAIEQLDDPLAIDGFCSNGRDDVHYWRLKDFSEPFNDRVKARLAGMQGQLSTRMGAAIRHSASALRLQASQKRLLLVLTDGEPSDIDERDPQYLRQDARKAVEQAARDGVDTFCISLDPQADDYVSRIFGANRYLVMDHIERLPERLPILYAALTR
jgi:nitric oxide reductase NorD protein